jgi:hypothetical protein
LAATGISVLLPRLAGLPRVDAIGRAYPQRGGAIEVQRPHIVGLGVGTGRVIDAEMLEAAGTGRQIIEPARPGRGPDSALVIHCHRIHIVELQAVRPAIFMLVDQECAAAWIEVL